MIPIKTVIMKYYTQKFGSVTSMASSKGKGGTGRGTGKKGWNRWQASANKAKSAKPYKSKGVKHQKNDD